MCDCVCAFQTVSDKISALLSNCVPSRRKPDVSGSQTTAPVAPSQSPKKASKKKKGSVPVLVEYYQGLANESGSSYEITRKQEFVTTSSTVVSSNTDMTTMSSYDSSSSSTTAEIYKTSNTLSVGIRRDTNHLRPLKSS